jgi:diguanylate cyclase (GGDEF)-like protein/hemerythrin-like metal-binding protein
MVPPPRIAEDERVETLFPFLACFFALVAGFSMGVLFSRRKEAARPGLDDRSLVQAVDTLESTNRELRDVVDALEHAAGTDRLTGAWNRRRFEEAAHAEMSLAHRRGTPVSMLMIDIDRFKRVNDSMGHEAGDAVLVGVANSIRDQLRGSDPLARWGGEEFLVLSPINRLEGGQVLAEKLRKAVAAMQFPGLGSVTISVGVAEHVTGETLAQWIGRADRAVYAAKKAGRNRVALDPDRSTMAAPGEPSSLEIPWDERHFSGHALIDQQHQKLVNLANGLLAGLTSHQPVDELALRMKRICAQAAQHFLDEEKYLRSIGWPGLDDHVEQHKRLLEKARQLQAETEKGSLDLGQVTSFLAMDLVLGHIVQEDTKYFSLVDQGSVAG